MVESKVEEERRGQCGEMLHRRREEDGGLYTEPSLMTSTSPGTETGPTGEEDSRDSTCCS